MNRRLRYMSQALDNVQTVKNEPAEKTRDTYGSFCHDLPIFVRQDGLAQTVAYIEDKAGGNTNQPSDAQKAYQLLRGHMAQTIGVGGSLLTHVRQAHLPQYMRDTTAILEAWIFYKRFAVSILDVEAGQDTREE